MNRTAVLGTAVTKCTELIGGGAWSRTPTDLILVTYPVMSALLNFSSYDPDFHYCVLSQLGLPRGILGAQDSYKLVLARGEGRKERVRLGYRDVYLN